MNLLNIGCGATFHPEWTNIDMNVSSPHVRAYDIRHGLPYPDHAFRAVYSSHMFEHLRKDAVQPFLAEAMRVLVPGGVLRIVVPDLEAIVRLYVEKLDAVEAGMTEAEPDYHWMMLELYDQVVRDVSGGDMKTYFRGHEIKNGNFVRSRIGEEGVRYWQEQHTVSPRFLLDTTQIRSLAWFIKKIRYRIGRYVIGVLTGAETKRAFGEGVFRHYSGEVHRWMYDRFSLRRLMEGAGLQDVHPCRAAESSIPNFNTYGLDVVNGTIRKPDSLFMEGIKP